VSALGNLGVIYAQQGNNGKAEAVLRQALEDDPKYAQGHLNLGLILAQQQKYAAAEAELQKALQLTPNDERTLSAMGKVECRLGKNSEGIGLLERVAAMQPESAAAHLDLAIAEADSYDLKHALVEAETAVRLAPNAAATHFNRGELLFDLGRPTEARQEFETVVRLAPEMPRPHYYLALIDKQAGDYEAAVRNLQVVVKDEPRNVMAWHLLGQCLESESKHADAIGAWKQALTINPQYTQTLWSLGHALKNSDPQEGATLLERFDEIQKRNKILDRAATLNNDAAALMRQGEWDSATAKLKEALQICANCAVSQDIHKNLGLAYCHAGDLEGGEKELRLAEAAKPGDPDVARALTLIGQTRSKQAQSGQQVR
jgi:tetratricopeptide (TPR) repeat protein